MSPFRNATLGAVSRFGTQAPDRLLLKNAAAPRSFFWRPIANACLLLHDCRVSEATDARAEAQRWRQEAKQHTSGERS